MTSNPPLPAPLLAPGLKFSGTVAHLIAQALQRHGVEVVFGQSLPSMLHLACEQAGIRQLAYRTENAGGYMADAHARLTLRPSIVTAQNGPAATLLVAPLAEALKASVPLIALVQDVNRADTDRNAFQDLDHLQLFAGCAKWIRRVTEASRVEDYVDQAFVAACSGRPGPVVLLLPADLLQEAAPPAQRRANLGRFPLDRPVAAPDALRQAATLLAGARAPLVIAGGGVHLSGAHDALAALQEAAHLPVATTVMGKGAVDELHPLSIGVVGYFMGRNGATRHHRELVTQADVVLLVGTRTNQNGTDSWKLYPRGATYIHLDADPTEVGRNYEALRLVGDARETLAALTRELAAADLSVRAGQRTALQGRIAGARDAHRREAQAVVGSAAVPVRPERVMQELDRVLTPDSLVVSDASYSSVWTSNYLTSRRAGMRFLTPRGLAGLGWGFPMALGAKVARPDAEVFCVAGDGGFGHVWSELETAARGGLRVTLIVLNNGILGFQKHAENVKYGAHTTAVDFAPVDHAAIARACGCDGIRVTHPDELAPALQQARRSAVTTLIDVVCDPNAFPPLTFFTPDVVAAPA
ncbi:MULTISPECIES: acetolactate synthase catalytic subunit [Ramlibacter]|uniref:Acetolactate synthase catalytic subunit n=1 Tax=Ramlibacter pinisoli TaxID=2682844 RepID=A0A6N8IP56_9BURK|nr:MULTISPECIES: acetolactate synthase catalytic subunit [Ramlibacter]MBA2963536.1 acetolactate synthase catalytic subunit [Ramlibacter sp. CGMCC 1.13660]MVQ28502.1 acetolactate synthase catalytic subunit [Ramlibacter pinisoli]